MEDSSKYPESGENDYVSRQEALKRRVATAARAMVDRGITPTVARIRAALGGGSPNDLAPALRVWKESVASSATNFAKSPALPVPIADLAQELWQRAIGAAVVELNGGAAALAKRAEGDEAEMLRGQVTSLRRELERESMLYGELRAQASRHEAIARDALARLEASEARERKHLRDLGSAREHIAELTGTLGQLQARPAASKAPRGRRPSRSPPKAKARRSMAARARMKPRAGRPARGRGGKPRSAAGRRKTARAKRRRQRRGYELTN